MSRGRRALSAEVKALKGNPGKRKLALKKIGARVARPLAFTASPPEFLTHERERQAFAWAIETLPANVARASDVNAIARWAAWLHVWVTCKLALDGKAHWYTTESNFVKIHREHPLSKRMDKAEGHLISLEDRLGLNVVARNNIVHRLFQMPGAPAGGLFGEEVNDADVEQPVGDMPEPETVSPLGFLQQAGKPH